MTKFFISFYERTGSTMLCHMLNKHPDIMCRFELLATPYERITENKSFSKEDALYEILKIYNQDKNKSIGFKFKYPNQYNYYPEVTKYLYGNHDIKIIFLYRKNVIKQAISKINQLALTKSHQVANLEKRIPIQKILFDEQSKFFFYQYTMHYILSTKLMYYFIKKRPNTIIISYEDLCQYKEKNISTICNFLEIDFKKTMIENIPIIKISNHDIHQNIINPIQFDNFIQSFGLEIFLDKDPIIEHWPETFFDGVFELERILQHKG